MNNLPPQASDKWISSLPQIEQGWIEFAHANYTAAEEHFPVVYKYSNAATKHSIPGVDRPA